MKAIKGFFVKVGKNWKEATIWTRAATIMLIMVLVATAIVVPVLCVSISHQEAKIDSLRSQLAASQGQSCSAQQQTINDLRLQLGQCNGSIACDCSASANCSGITTFQQQIVSLQEQLNTCNNNTSSGCACNCSALQIELQGCWAEKQDLVSGDQTLEQFIRSHDLVVPEH